MVDGVTNPGRLVAAHEAVVVFYRAQLARHEPARAYLAARGLAGVVARSDPWQVGYAPAGWSSATRYLLRRGFTAAELADAGLAVPGARGHPVDRFRDRIMFPIRSSAGATVAFIGRTLGADAADGGGAPKYLNSPDSPIYSKGSLLFGLAEQRPRLAAGWRPVLVEGPVDAVAVYLCHARDGRGGAVALAPCGTALTRRQATIAAGVASEGLVVAFDGDAAGHAAAERAWRLLYPELAGRPLLGAGFAAGADPGDLLAAGRRGRLRTALAAAGPLVDQLVEQRLAARADRGRFVEERLGTARTLAPLLAQAAPADSIRLVAHVADRLDLGVDTVMQTVIVELERPPRRLDEPAAPQLAGQGYPAGPGGPAPVSAPAAALHPGPGPAVPARRR